MTMAYNGPSWSISDEMFFYVAYVGLVAPARWLRVLVVAAPIALAVALSTRHGCFQPSEGSGGAPSSAPLCVTLVGTFPPARLIEFLAGVALCHFRPRIPQILGLTAALAMAGGFVPAVAGTSGTSLFAHVVWQFEVIIGGGLLIVSLANDGWLARLLSFRWLVIGGEINYSIYMTHQIVNFVVLPRADGLGLAATFALVSAITVVVSLCLFYFVEAPVRDAVKLRLQRWRSSRFHSAEGRAVSAEAGSAVASRASF
jgi:peptidoglycan/LPS O-acetylase OafA/YrhL